MAVATQRARHARRSWPRRSRRRARPARRCASAAAARSRLGRRAAPEGAIELSTAGLDQDRRAQRGRPDRRARGRRAARRGAGAVRQGGPDARARPARTPAARTIGGVVATGDTGPLRGRYGGAARPRGRACAWRSSDGTLAKSGGKVIKNVAGYDIAKLFAGSFGTLGAIVEVSVRLHPLAPDTATAVGDAHSPDELARGAAARSRASPLEQHGHRHRLGRGPRARARALRRRGAAAAGRGGRGAAARGGARHRDRRRRRAALGRAARGAARPAGGEGVRPADRPRRTWRARRTSRGGSRGRAAAGARPLVAALRGAERGGGRSGCGASFALRRGAGPPGRTSTSTRPARSTRASRELMRRVKERFDPAGVCV